MKIRELEWPVDEDGLLLDIESGVVAYLHRGRNAWHSTWVRHYFANSALFPDVSSAQGEAEMMRGQGNVFYIVEVPAILLRGPEFGVVITDHSSVDSFSSFSGFDVLIGETENGRWIDGIYPGVGMRDAVACFGASSEHWESLRRLDDFHVGMVPTDFDFSEREGALRRLESYGQGSRYLLGWVASTKTGDFQRSGAEAVATRWRSTIDAVVDVCDDLRIRESAFAWHRDEVLQAIPRALWMARERERRSTERSESFEEWQVAATLRREVEDNLRQAEVKLREARERLYSPAETSAGVRAQRQRFELAMAAVATLKEESSEAAEVEWVAYARYRELLELGTEP